MCFVGSNNDSHTHLDINISHIDTEEIKSDKSFPIKPIPTRN